MFEHTRQQGHEKTTNVNSKQPKYLQRRNTLGRRNHAKKIIRKVGRSFQSYFRVNTRKKKLYKIIPKSIVSVLSEVETKTKKYVLTIAKLFYGTTPKKCRQLVFKFVETNNIS